MKKIALFILLNFVFTACDFDRNTGMNVFNKSKTVIYTFVSCSDSLKDIDYTFFYSVYTYGKNRQDTVYLNNRIQQDSISNIVFTYELKPIFQNCNDHKLRIFFIRESILKERTWDEICHEKLYEKLTVTEEELKKNNWTVIYE